MAVLFAPRIKWKETVNENVYPYEGLGIKLPPGLNPPMAREPKFVSVAEMGKLVTTTAHNTSGGLSIVEGLVSNDFQLRFPDPVAQWRILPGPDGKPPTRGPVNFQFQDGEVTMELTLGLYILDSVKPGEDKKSQQIFKIHYEHELLHVLDESDIMTKWLPGQVKTEPTGAKYFVRREPFTYGLQSQTTDQVRADFLKYIAQPFFNLWAAESNRREALRDTQEEYNRLSDQITKIRYGNSTR